MQDKFGREIDYLRISVTENCNMNCRYCRPGNERLKQKCGLSLRDIRTIAEAAAEIGFRYIRLTGGEPLVRDDLAEIVREVKSIDGIEDVAITTNGLFLDEKLDELIEAGLDGVNISIDTMDRAVYKSITGVDGLDRVLGAMERAQNCIRVRINAVLINGINDRAYRELIKLTLDRPVDVRFIELMPIGAGRSLSGPGNEDVRRGILEEYTLEAAGRTDKDTGPADYFRIPGAKGRIGFISAVHKGFCQSCNRLRITADGRIKMCLCYGDYLDLKPALSGDEKTAERSVCEMLEKAIEMKPGRHCFDSPEKITEKGKMYSIGG